MSNKSNPSAKRALRQSKPEDLTAGRNSQVNQIPYCHTGSRTPPTRFFLRAGVLFKVAGQQKK
jgi:hypothetical protein